VFFSLYQPAPPLDSYVENFWWYNGYTSPHLKERILPDGTFKAVFNLQHDEFRIYDGWQPTKVRRFSGAIVSRPSGAPFVTDSAEEACVLGVNFRIGGALPLLGYAAVEPGTCHVDLQDIWGDGVIELHERLTDTPRLADRFALLELALLRRLACGTRHHPVVDASLGRLECGGPASRTQELARQVGLSQRRLITLFKQDIGITPKLFNRIRRFQRTLHLMRQSAAPEWSQVALDAGYYDQSHMIRDFVAFSGFSPGDYLRRQRLLADEGVRTKHNHIPLTD
jgi:AraC-like DNA-binding protein